MPVNEEHYRHERAARRVGVTARTAERAAGPITRSRVPSRFCGATSAMIYQEALNGFVPEHEFERVLGLLVRPSDALQPHALRRSCSVPLRP